MFSLNIIIHIDIFIAISNPFCSKYSLNICIYSQLFKLEDCLEEEEIEEKQRRKMFIHLTVSVRHHLDTIDIMGNIT